MAKRDRCSLLSQGIAVSSTGRLFSNYPPGLDPNNTNDGSNGKHTVAELFANNTERPYPSAEYNNSPGGAINYTTTPPCTLYIASLFLLTLPPSIRCLVFFSSQIQLLFLTVPLFSRRELPRSSHWSPKRRDRPARPPLDPRHRPRPDERRHARPSLRRRAQANRRRPDHRHNHPDHRLSAGRRDALLLPQRRALRPEGQPLRGL